MNSIQLDELKYQPGKLLDGMQEKLGAKNDAELSRMLHVAPPIISKIRHLRAPVSSSILLRMHEESQLEIRDLQEMMGDRRQKYRLSSAQGRPAASTAPAHAAPAASAASVAKRSPR